MAYPALGLSPKLFPIGVIGRALVSQMLETKAEGLSVHFYAVLQNHLFRPGKRALRTTLIFLLVVVMVKREFSVILPKRRVRVIASVLVSRLILAPPMKLALALSVVGPCAAPLFAFTRTLFLFRHTKRHCQLYIGAWANTLRS